MNILFVLFSTSIAVGRLFAAPGAALVPHCGEKELDRCYEMGPCNAKFYCCLGEGRALIVECPEAIQHFAEKIQECMVKPECSGHSSDDATNSTTTLHLSTTSTPQTDPLTAGKAEKNIIYNYGFCQKMPDGRYHPDSVGSKCSRHFYECVHAITFIHICEDGLKFDPVTLTCQQAIFVSNCREYFPLPPDTEAASASEKSSHVLPADRMDRNLEKEEIIQTPEESPVETQAPVHVDSGSESTVDSEPKSPTAFTLIDVLKGENTPAHHAADESSMDESSSGSTTASASIDTTPEFSAKSSIAIENDEPEIDVFQAKKSETAEEKENQQSAGESSSTSPEMRGSSSAISQKSESTPETTTPQENLGSSSSDQHQRSSSVYFSGPMKNNQQISEDDEDFFELHTFDGSAYSGNSGDEPALVSHTKVVEEAGETRGEIWTTGEAFTKKDDIIIINNPLGPISNVEPISNADTAFENRASTKMAAIVDDKNLMVNLDHVSSYSSSPRPETDFESSTTIADDFGIFLPVDRKKVQDKKPASQKPIEQFEGSGSGDEDYAPRKLLDELELGRKISSQETNNRTADAQNLISDKTEEPDLGEVNSAEDEEEEEDGDDELEEEATFSNGVLFGRSSPNFKILDEASEESSENSGSTEKSDHYFDSGLSEKDFDTKTTKKLEKIDNIEDESENPVHSSSHSHPSTSSSSSQSPKINESEGSFVEEVIIDNIKHAHLRPKIIGEEMENEDDEDDIEGGVVGAEASKTKIYDKKLHSLCVTRRGNFADPVKKCSNLFYTCLRGDALFRRSCYFDYVYNPAINRCVPVEKMPACQIPASDDSVSTTSQLVSDTESKSSLRTDGTPVVTFVESTKELDCNNRARGNYGDPNRDCSEFYFTCTKRGRALLQQCPESLFFDPAVGFCDDRDAVPACFTSSEAEEPNSTVS